MGNPLLSLIALPFCALVYAAYQSWRKMSAGKRILGVLLLSPHFLLFVCFGVSLLCGHTPRKDRIASTYSFYAAFSWYSFCRFRLWWATAQTVGTQPKTDRKLRRSERTFEVTIRACLC